MCTIKHTLMCTHTFCLVLLKIFNPMQEGNIKTKDIAFKFK